MSVCYVAPGQHLLSTAGPTRNVLNLAAALARRADVTVAFRTALDGPVGSGIRVLEIDAQDRHGARGAVLDDAAVRGVGLGEFVRYTRTVRRFARRELARFDLVFEKSWTLSGLVAWECRKLGVPALVVENLVPVLGKPAGGHHGLGKRAKLWAGRMLAGRYLRRADGIIAETGVLKSAMVEHWHIPEENIAVVPLGVDRERFRPMDREATRRELRIASDAIVLLYSGIVDHTHNLRPVVEALCAASAARPELHVIGDGPLRPELERYAAAHRATVRFHGRVPYERVPAYIAAADLCLAPYEPAAFPGGQVAYSSLKIPEYMSAGRAVVSVPSGRVLDLVQDGVTGFLFPNTAADWSRFLAALPDRARLIAMGEAALQSGFQTWDDVAAAYLRLGQAVDGFSVATGIGRL